MDLSVLQDVKEPGCAYHYQLFKGGKLIPPKLQLRELDAHSRSKCGMQQRGATA